MIKPFGKILTTTLFIVSLSGNAMAGEQGVFKDKIIIGSPADLQGPAAFASQASIAGARAYFAKAYAEKIYPRRIDIIQEHGGYSPAICIKAAKLLLQRDRIFCFFLSSGTSATLALNTLLEEEKVPLIGMHCQAEAAALPPKRHLFQMFTTYVDQAKIAVDYIVEQAGSDARVAIFYQDDEFGFDGLKGFRMQMDKYGIKPVAEVSYKRGAIDFSSPALKLKYAKPDWVIVHTLWAAGSSLLKEARKMGWQPQFLGISGTADPYILELAGEAADYGKPMKGILVSYPFDGDSPGAVEYRQDLKRYQPKAKPGTFSFWGYGFAKILIEGLRRIEGEPSRQKLIVALESFKDVQTGVFPPLTWNVHSRRGSQGGMVVIKKGRSFVPLTGWYYPK